MTALDQLLARQHIWQANRQPASSTEAIASGYACLDALFPGGGWPRGALSEILCPQPGIGELQLLLPALAQSSREPRWQLWLAPPWLPYAPALQQGGVALERILLVTAGNPKHNLWTLEQALRSGACSLVIGWQPKLNHSDLRRLQLAAASGNAVGILFRSPQQATQHSPAALRLLLERRPQGLGVSILKRRGGWPVAQQVLPLAQLPGLGAFAEAAP